MTENKLIAINAIDLQDEELLAVLGIVERLVTIEHIYAEFEDYQIRAELYEQQL